MKKIKENLSYIVNEEDNDQIKINKIFKKLKENEIDIFFNKINIEKLQENYVFSNIEIIIKNKENEEKILIPYISSYSDFNDNLFKTINNLKQQIILEKLNLFLENKKEFSEEKCSNITPKQKQLINDKFKDNKYIINKKLEEFGLKNINDLKKDQASKIIDSLTKRSI